MYESGSNRGSFCKYSDDSIGLVRINAAGKVEYLVDGAPRYTSIKEPTYPLGVDPSILTSEAQLKNISWVGAEKVNDAFVGGVVQFTSFNRVTGEGQDPG